MKSRFAEIVRLRRGDLENEYNNLAILADSLATKISLPRVQGHLTRLYIYFRSKDYHNFLEERDKLLKTLYNVKGRDEKPEEKIPVKKQIDKKIRFKS